MAPPKLPTTNGFPVEMAVMRAGGDRRDSGWLRSGLGFLARVEIRPLRRHRNEHLLLLLQKPTVRRPQLAPPGKLGIKDYSQPAAA